MAIDFPSSPADGAIHRPANQAQFRYSSAKTAWLRSTGWVLIAVQDGSATGYQPLYSMALPTDFRSFKLLCYGINPQTTGHGLEMRVHQGAGWVASASYSYCGMYAFPNNAGFFNTASFGAGADVFWHLTATGLDAVQEKLAFAEIDIEPGGSTHPSIMWRLTHHQNAVGNHVCVGYGYMNLNATRVQHVSLLHTLGNYFVRTMVLFGTR